LVTENAEKHDFAHVGREKVFQFWRFSPKFPFAANHGTIADMCLQSLIDDTELASIQSAAAHVKELAEAGNYEAAFSSYGRVMGLVDTYTDRIDHYNFLVFHKQDRPINKRTPLQHGKYSLR